MKSITHIRPTRKVSDEREQNPGFDHEVAFTDPVRYLAGLGIESRLVSQSGPTVVREAA